MAVKATTTVLHRGREYQPGETLPVSDAEGKRLVERGLAEAVKAAAKRGTSK